MLRWVFLKNLHRRVKRHFLIIIFPALFLFLFWLNSIITLSLSRFKNVFVQNNLQNNDEAKKKATKAKAMQSERSEMKITSSKTKKNEKSSFSEEMTKIKKKTQKKEDAQQFLQASFSTTMNLQEKQIFLETLQLFDHIWRIGLNLTYFLYGETLLGAVRHQGFVPWDDDVDLLIDIQHRNLLQTVFKNTKLSVMKQKSGKCKIFFKNSRPGMRRTWLGWSWPFLDVFFYSFIKNGSMLQEERNSNFIINSSLIFPSRFLAFENSRFPAPRCPHEALKRLFNLGFMRTCCTNGFNHRWENIDHKTICVPCDVVKMFYINSKWTKPVQQLC